MWAWIRVVEEFDVVHNPVLCKLISSLALALLAMYLRVIGARRANFERNSVDQARLLIGLDALAPRQLLLLLFFCFRSYGVQHTALRGAIVESVAAADHAGDFFAGDIAFRRYSGQSVLLADSFIQSVLEGFRLELLLVA